MRLRTRLPVVPDPRPRPLRRSVHDIRRVGRDGDAAEALAMPGPVAQSRDDRTELSPVAALDALVPERALLL